MQRGANHRDANGKSQPDRTGDTQRPASRGPALRAWAASGASPGLPAALRAGRPHLYVHSARLGGGGEGRRGDKETGQGGVGHLALGCVPVGLHPLQV